MPTVVSLDLLWIQLEWPLGLVLLCAAAVGLLMGLLLAWFFSILPLRARLRKAVRTEQGFSTAGSLKHIDD